MVKEAATQDFRGMIPQSVATFRQITGVLDGADFLLRIPNNWNGDMIVYCRGYSHLLSEVNLVVPADSFNWVVNSGFAFAESSYGAGGNCIKQAIICTHQLTEYVKRKFNVGKIYLVGVSMGGNIALHLGSKYPDLYRGVLDICGAKNMVSHCSDWQYYAGIESDVKLADDLVSRGFDHRPPYPFSSIADFRKWCKTTAADFELICKGTPTEKPHEYENISPLSGAANVAIPTITVHGTSDALIPYFASVEFMNAVKRVGNPDLYRLYSVVGGQHRNGPVLSQIDFRLPQLIQWAEGNIIPCDSY